MFLKKAVSCNTNSSYGGVQKWRGAVFCNTNSSYGGVPKWRGAVFCTPAGFPQRTQRGKKQSMTTLVFTESAQADQTNGDSA